MAALSITLRQGVCPRAPRVFFTRMSWPDPNTSWPDPCEQQTWIVTTSWTAAMNRSMQMMASPWCNDDIRIELTSQLPRHHIGTHLTRHQPRAKPSWAEPSREPRDRILCSRVYVQPDLRLNLSRWSGQNCFDQILAVWSAIWTIQDMFPANLIIPDAMVRSDRWDSRPKMAVVNY